MRIRRILPVLCVPALVLGACSSRDLVAPEVTSQPSSASPNLDSARIERVLGSIQDTLNTADATRDAAALEPRLEGGALRMRSDQYAAAKATNTEVPKLVVNQGSVAVTNSDQWPRVIVNVSSPDQASLPVLAFAVQDDARSKYKLVGWARALGGALAMPVTISMRVMILLVATCRMQRA